MSNPTIIKVNDRITIKGVSHNNPNHEGRVVEILEDGVIIANMNMPYMGTYAHKLVAWEDIE